MLAKLDVKNFYTLEAGDGLVWEIPELVHGAS